MAIDGMPRTPAEPAPDSPNVLLICVDQWRRDCLSIDGHPVVETPYLDQLALDGARFTRTYAATPTCIPARASLLTGLSQRHNGRISYRDGVPWDYPVTIASEFTRHGYQTGAVGKLHVYPPRSQMGFQNVVLHDGFLHVQRRKDHNLSLVDDYLPWLQRELGREADYFDHGVNVNGVTARPWDKPEYTHPSTWIVTEAIDFLRRRDTRKPFFLYLGFHRPHPPYDPPGWAFDQYDQQQMPEPVIGDWIDVLEEHRVNAMHNAHVSRYPRKILDRAKAGYYGNMTHIDHQLNRLFEHLRQFGVQDNTWICFVSDHGEMLGDHDLFRKGYAYEGSAGIPFILSGPPDSGIAPGTTSDAVAELRDVMPTLLDCAGLPVPDSIDGYSLLPVARQQSPGVRDVLHGEHMIFGQTMQWMTDGHEKHVWWSAAGHEQFFDLDADPTELHDLAADPGSAPRLEHWRQRLIHELAGREDGHSDGTRLIAGQPPMQILPSVLEGFRSSGQTNAAPAERER